MFWEIFRKPDFSLDQLEEIKKTIVFDRTNYRIAIIDDKKNTHLMDSLRSIGYRIDYYKDIRDVAMVHQHHIVICDIVGVGKFFGSTFEGGFLISEIRRVYPIKYLIAFSGNTFDFRYNQFFELCDSLMTKNTDINIWANQLDGAIKFINDPIKNWEKVRKFLLSSNISIEKVSKLEQIYIKSILQKMT